MLQKFQKQLVLQRDYKKKYPEIKVPKPKFLDSEEKKKVKASKTVSVIKFNSRNKLKFHKSNKGNFLEFPYILKIIGITL